MRIEINAHSIIDFESKMSSYISKKEDVISSFKAVKNQTLNLNGGVGSLRDAAGNIDKRIQREEKHLDSAKQVAKTVDDFLALTIRVDKEVATLVKKNREEFYRVNPWLRPPESSGSNPIERFFNWLWDKGGEIVEGIKSAWESIKSFFQAAIEAIKDFYEKYKEIIGYVVKLAVLIGAIIATGGLALPGVVALFTALGFSASIAAAIATTVTVVALVSTTASIGFSIAEQLGANGETFQALKKIFGFASFVSLGIIDVGKSFMSLTEKLASESVSLVSKIKDSVKFVKDTLGFEKEAFDKFKEIMDMSWVKEKLKAITGPIAIGIGIIKPRVAPPIAISIGIVLPKVAPSISIGIILPKIHTITPIVAPIVGPVAMAM